ncbi:hypothetical protein I7V34_20830 [Bacillus sp. V3]|nr:hypothetical protein I7V34_20830 [Bacillus sp. V3]
MKKKIKVTYTVSVDCLITRFAYISWGMVQFLFLNGWVRFLFHFGDYGAWKLKAFKMTACPHINNCE